MVKLQPSKLAMRVRFPSPALRRPLSGALTSIHYINSSLLGEQGRQP
jgi:hypothetical protein